MKWSQDYSPIEEIHPDGTLHLDLSKEEAKARINSLTRDLPSERNWDRFWCSYFDGDRFALMYHNGGAHWNDNQIRARLEGELHSIGSNQCELKYQLSLSKDFKKFAILWCSVVIVLCIFAMWASSQFEWVDESIRNLWIYMPMLTVPSAVIFTWRHGLATKNFPIQWLRSIFKNETASEKVKLGNLQLETNS